MEELILTVIIISSSGVLSPGPLLLSNIIHAKSYGYRAGLMIAYGHTIIELPLVLLLATSINFVFKEFDVIIGVIGGIALLFFGIYNIINFKKSSRLIIHKPIISGMIFTAFNPFFIAWWLTIGIKLINDSLALMDLNGVFIMFMLHIWMDYAWLIFIAYISKKGITMLDSRYYRYLIIALNSIIIYFGINFLTSTLYA